MRFYIWECQKDKECKFGVTSKTVLERIQDEIHFIHKDNRNLSYYKIHLDLPTDNAYYIEKKCIKYIIKLGVKKSNTHQERFINKNNSIEKVSDFARLLNHKKGIKI